MRGDPNEKRGMGVIGALLKLYICPTPLYKELMAVIPADIQGVIMKLVYDNTNVEVKSGDVVHVRNVPYYIEAIIEPHKPSSSGRVWCRSMCESKYFSEWFPSVIGAHWIERTDQGEIETYVDENGQSYLIYK